MSLRSTANQSVLMSIRSSVPKAEIPEQPQRVYRDVKKGEVYLIDRHGQANTVVVDEVKRDTVKIKRDVNAKDSQSIPRARFDQFYTKVAD